MRGLTVSGKKLPAYVCCVGRACCCPGTWMTCSDRIGRGALWRVSWAVHCHQKGEDWGQLCRADSNMKANCSIGKERQKLLSMESFLQRARLPRGSWEWALAPGRKWQDKCICFIATSTYLPLSSGFKEEFSELPPQLVWCRSHLISFRGSIMMGVLCRFKETVCVAFVCSGAGRKWFPNTLHLLEAWDLTNRLRLVSSKAVLRRWSKWSGKQG